MSALLDTRKASYQQQRAASQGAGITLVVGCGQFVATFECATRCAEVLGSRTLEDAGDGIFEVIPIYKIPLEDISLALAKLSARFSVALVDVACDGKSNLRFVLVWKIVPQPSKAGPAQKEINWDEY